MREVLMKIKSPLGEFPVEINRIKIKNGALVVEVSMGAWPTTIQIFLSDILIFFWIIFKKYGKYMIMLAVLIGILFIFSQFN